MGLMIPDLSGSGVGIHHRTRSRNRDGIENRSGDPSISIPMAISILKTLLHSLSLLLPLDGGGWVGVLVGLPG